MLLPMSLQIMLPLLVCVVGGLGYLLLSKPEAKTMALVAFAVGLLLTTFQFMGRALHL